MFTEDIFDRLEQLLNEDSVDIAIYDGEFFDPDRLMALQQRYSTKDGYLMDIEGIEVLETDSSGTSPKCRITVVIYCAHSNKRHVDLKVKGSMGLAAKAMKSLTGRYVAAGDDHNAAPFMFAEVIKEDQIPYVSVHAVRFTLDMVLDLTA